MDAAVAEQGPWVPAEGRGAWPLVDSGTVKANSSERLAYAVAALILGCASMTHVPPEDVYKSGPSPNEVEAESVARSWVADNVQNPSSAVIRNVVVVRPYRISFGFCGGVPLRVGDRV